MFCFFLTGKAQVLNSLVTAVNDPQKSVQAIHHYPNNIQDGKCHHVHVTSITVSGDKITIVEQWTDWKKSPSKTTLTGQLSNNVATGQWSSGFSSGNWTFNFANNSGTWNKTNTMFGKFRDFQILEFRIVSKDQLKDGFYECPSR